MAGGNVTRQKTETLTPSFGDVIVESHLIARVPEMRLIPLTVQRRDECKCFPPISHDSENSYSSLGFEPGDCFPGIILTVTVAIEEFSATTLPLSITYFWRTVALIVNRIFTDALTSERSHENRRFHLSIGELP